jgi:hypothetical protein
MSALNSTEKLLDKCCQTGLWLTLAAQNSFAEGLELRQQ